MNREQYSAGYQAGLKGRKAPKAGADADYVTGYEHGAADRRYNQRAKECDKLFGSRGYLPSQTSFIGGES